MYQKGKCQDCGYISLKQPEGLQSRGSPLFASKMRRCKRYFFMTYIEKTILVYVSPATGSLILDNETYEIKEGRAFSFPKGVSHYTVNTGEEPRLLIGPMSEQGFYVGFSTIYYLPTYNDVFPDPNLANIVYSEQHSHPFSATVASSTTFPDNSSIPPPYEWYVLSSWAGQMGYTGNFTPVSSSLSLNK